MCVVLWERLMNPLFHIGLHKTGTSWLQVHLFGRTDRGFHPIVDDAGRFAQGDKAAAKFLANYLIRTPGRYLMHPCEDRTAKVNELLQASGSRNGSCPVVSDEQLSGSPHAGNFNVSDIARRIKAAAPDARILIVIRRQQDLLLSTYIQYLRMGGTSTLRQYAGRKFIRLPTFQIANLDFNRIRDLYVEQFGASRVLVLPYEMLQRDPRGFLSLLKDFSGAAVPDELPTNKRENEVTKRFAAGLYLTRWLNLLALSDSVNGYSPLASRGGRLAVHGLRLVLARLLGEWLTRRIMQRLLGEAETLCAGRFGAANQLLSDRSGIDLTLYGYDMPARGTGVPRGENCSG